MGHGSRSRGQRMKLIKNFPDDPGPSELKKLARLVILKKQSVIIDPVNAQRYTAEAADGRTLLHTYKGSTKNEND